MAFLNYYLQILIFTCLLPLGLGLGVYFCNRAFCVLVGRRRGRPLLLFLHALLTPVREFAHLVACVLTFHQVSDFCLLNLRDPEGELGFVEHSYNRKDPIAVFGNYLFAVLPAALGLFLSMVVILACFRGSFGTLSDSVSDLVKTGAGFSAYVKLALDFFPSLFRDGAVGIFSKIVGSLLLLLLSLGVFVSLDDLRGGFFGCLLYAAVAFVFAGITSLFDARARRLILSCFRTFATGIIALYLVVLFFAAAMLVLGLLFFIFRMIFGEGRAAPPIYEAEEDEPNSEEYNT